MLKWLKEHFSASGYEVETYDDKFLPARVPLYCKKDEEGGIDEVVIDIITDEIIKKRDFFPSLLIGRVKILEASPTRFYQYYFPKAKIFFAFPDYSHENDEFHDFKKVCEQEGIGLLKTSEKKIDEVIKPQPLFDEILTKLDNNKMNHDKIENIIGDCLENYLHYLVYYPAPTYKRRAITGRTEGDISFILIDKLRELRNITYKDKLIKLASEYRQEDRDDYKIALETITELWLEICKLKYPEIQRQLEDILLRNSEYRDHFLHQFQVFLLGTYIIDKFYSNNEKCVKEFHSLYKCPIEEAWLLASTYHDFNYSIQQYDFWIKEFIAQALSTTGKDNLSPLKLDAAFIRENFLLKTKEICKALNLEMNHIVMNFFYEQAVNKDTRNHGVLSALSLLKLCENLGHEQIKYPTLIQAAVAIALHDGNIWKPFSGIKGSINSEWNDKFADEKFLINMEFTKYPLAFLLIFCDAIQEWGRVGKSYKESKPRLEDISISNKPSEIKVSLSVKDDLSYENKEKEVLQIKKFLKDTRFEIELISREGGQTTKIAMKGK